MTSERLPRCDQVRITLYVPLRQVHQAGRFGRFVRSLADL